MDYFKLHFEDGTIFQGQTIPNSNWNKSPDKKITMLEYSYDKGRVLLKGYKQYHHLYEQQAKMGHPTKITCVMIMGRTDDKTLVIIFDFKTGKVFTEFREYGKEYGNQILSNWKDGVLNNPNFKLFKRTHSD